MKSYLKKPRFAPANLMPLLNIWQNPIFYQMIVSIFLIMSLLSPVQACWTPLEWQKKPVNWIRDANKNSIEDSLDKLLEKKPNDSVHANVVVDISRCPKDSDIKWLSQFGKILKKGRLITFVAMEVNINKLPELVKNPLVAMVEEMHGFSPSLNVSGAAIKVRSSSTYPNNLEDIFPAIDGTGTTVAIIDSGVDDQAGSGTTHESFPSSKFVGGYDAQTNLFNNPDDNTFFSTTNGHGTHVAGIAIGTGGSSQNHRGMAPAARLVDCRLDWTFLGVIECFEQIYLNQPTWKVDVMNLSFGQQNVSSDGLDAVSQLANFLVSQGITVVASAGNDGPNNSGLSSPCAADNVICVGAIDDQNNISRNNDQIASYSSRGPRANDGDLDTADEEKPEVVAPGSNILSAQYNSSNNYVSKSGTSMASPHVAGLAALVKQAHPGINPGSIKNLIIQTAEDLGSPGWNPDSGYGYVDAFQAISAAAIIDPGYPNAGTYPEPWLCSDITTATSPQVNVPNTIISMVRNNTSVPANNVEVTFGVHIYSAGIPNFYSIGAKTIPTLPANTTMLVTHPWTPQPSPTGDSHACLKSTINYGFDTDFSNNLCNRNISVNQTNSPVKFRFQVNNTLVEPATITLEPTPVVKFPSQLMGNRKYRILPGERIFVQSRWKQSLDNQRFKMTPLECAKDNTLTLDSVDDALAVEGAIYNVAAIATTEDGKKITLGGITAYGHTTCPSRWGGDNDGDSVCDLFDNCPKVANPEQLDKDKDGLGNMCDSEVEVPNQKPCVIDATNENFKAHSCMEGIKEFTKILDKTTAAIFINKSNSIQEAFCRRRNLEAEARIDAMLQHISLLQKINELTPNNASKFTKLLAACRADRLSVTLDTFTANAANGKITINWTTGSETNNAGFTLWRATPIDGQCSTNLSNYKDARQVQPLVYSQSQDGVLGASYSEEDQNVEAKVTYCYGLEDVDYDGIRTFHIDKIISATLN